MDENVPKSRLRNITMHVHRFRMEDRRKFTQFTWDLDSFFESENSAVYTKKIEEFNFSLYLTKNGDFFTVTIDTNRELVSLDMLCCALSGDGYISGFFCVSQVSRYLHQVTFPPGEVESLKNSSLSNCGSIKLQFLTGTKTKTFFYPGRCNLDFSRFVEFRDNETLWKTGRKGLFGMQPTEGPKMFCHRSLLAARSTFFRNYFSEQSDNIDEMSIIAPSKSLAILIYYLYSGILAVDQLPMMLDIVKLAWELDILSLKGRCAQSLPRFIKADNVFEIRRLGIESGLSVLVESADDFLAKNKMTESITTDSGKTTNSRKKTQVKYQVP